MASPYLVPVFQLLHDVPSRRAVDFRAPFDAEHEFEPRPMSESDVPLDSEVDVALCLDSHFGGITARGSIRSPWRGLCRRCSVPILGELEVEVNERFVENPEPDDDEAYPISGDFLNLLQLVHDSVLLELPTAPLCRADCQGLCPICGIDLNDSRCDCLAERDARWATLDALRLEDESSSD